MTLPEGYKYDWSSQEVGRILALIKDNIQKHTPKEEVSPALMGYVDPDDQGDQARMHYESVAEYEGRRVLIDEADVRAFLDETLDSYYQAYAGQEGQYPTQGGLNNAASIIQDFLFNDDPNKKSSIYFPGQPKTGVTLDVLLEQNIFKNLSWIFDNKRIEIESNPLYFTQDLKFEALLNGFQGEGILSDEERGDPATVEQIRQKFPEIWEDLRRHGKANPSAETVARDALQRALGLKGSGDDPVEWGYLLTVPTNNPLSKEEFIQREEARLSTQELSEAETNEIIKDPKKWLEDYYSNPLNFPDFYKPTTTEGEAEFDTWLERKGYELEATIKEWQTARSAFPTTVDESGREIGAGIGGLKYDLSDIGRMATSTARAYVTTAPRLQGIDAASEAESSYTKMSTPTNFSTAVDTYIQGKFGIGQQGTISTERKNQMASQLWSMFQSAQQSGQAAPNANSTLDEMFGSYLGDMQTEKRAEDAVSDKLPEEWAKNFLGLPEKNALDQDISDFEAKEKLAGRIGDVLDDYPGFVDNPEIAAQSAMYGYGVTPMGELKPFTAQRVDPITGMRIQESGAELMQNLHMYPGFVQNVVNYAQNRPQGDIVSGWGNETALPWQLFGQINDMGVWEPFSSTTTGITGKEFDMPMTAMPQPYGVGPSKRGNFEPWMAPRPLEPSLPTRGSGTRRDTVGKDPWLYAHEPDYTNESYFDLGPEYGTISPTAMEVQTRSSLESPIEYIPPEEELF